MIAYVFTELKAYPIGARRREHAVGGGAERVIEARADELALVARLLDARARAGDQRDGAAPKAGGVWSRCHRARALLTLPYPTP